MVFKPLWELNVGLTSSKSSFKTKKKFVGTFGELVGASLGMFKNWLVPLTKLFLKLSVLGGVPAQACPQLLPLRLWRASHRGIAQPHHRTCERRIVCRVVPPTRISPAIVNMRLPQAVPLVSYLNPIFSTIHTHTGCPLVLSRIQGNRTLL